MAYILADISDYDPDYAADDYSAGVIINAEARSLGEKARIAHEAGVPIHIYSWVYAGDNGYSVTRSYAVADLLALNGVPVVHHWLDYEEAGCTPRDLQAAAVRVDPNREPVGTYTYLSVLPSVRGVLVGPLWLAYYPEGYVYVDYYPGMSQTARNEGAVMHQFTSVAPPDGRDLSAVVDEVWYASLGSVVTPPAPEPEIPEGGDNMLFVTNAEGKTAVFIRTGTKLYIRGATQGGFGPAALLSDQCDPANFDLELREGFGQFVYAVGVDGKLVQAAPGQFGPVTTLV